MRSRARVLGHAIHPIVIVYPLGLLTTAIVFDLLYVLTDRANFAVASAHMIAAGLLGGILAGVFGLVDWTSLPAGTRAKRIGTLHGLINAAMLAVFLASWLIRRGAPDWEPNAIAILIALAGVAIGGAGGWLGGEMVQRLGVSVDPEAHLDAPSTLSGLPAKEKPTS